MSTFSRYEMPSDTNWQVPGEFEKERDAEEFGRNHGIRPESLQA